VTLNSFHSKVQLKLAINRLKLQKAKKENLIKEQKRQIAELLKQGKDESARIKVHMVTTLVVLRA
jgi:vacuolar protein sorting-associated protein IST1